MKGRRIQTEELVEAGPVAEVVVDDAEWGSSTGGPVEAGDTVPTSPTGVTEHEIERDERLDPWIGRSVQDPSRLPSGHVERRVAPARDAESPDDESAGGLAGIVGRDDRLIDRGK